MPVDQFNVCQFAITLQSRNGNSRFVHELNKNEHCWVHYMPNPKIRLFVRSTIGPSGVSASLGKDSIKVFIQRIRHGRWVNIARGPDAYTTRIPGWEGRLREKIVIIAKKAAQITEDFNDDETICFVSTDSPNKLRPYVRKDGKSHFKWLDGLNNNKEPIRR